jgi:Uma2 family endonuclease
MSVPLKERRFTPTEYYALERAATYKSDYYKGEIFDMSGGTSTHSRITTNLVGSLWKQLGGGRCEAFESNMRLAVLATGLRTYPDASVYCDPLVYDVEDPENTTATNPAVVFEVLSPSTEAYDRGLNSENYRRIESLKAYVLIAQKEPLAQLFTREPDGTWSTPIDASGLGASLRIDCIGVTLQLGEIYQRVTFPPG